MNLCAPNVIRSLMEENGIRFRKEYGQNFLTDPNVPRQIAESAVSPETEMALEIGPGIGCLTQELCLRAPAVTAVEIDRGLIPILNLTMAPYKNLTLHNADILKTDLSALIGNIDPRHVAVCANLPYYITTPILMVLLESRLRFESVTVMVQNEVAARLCAKAGSPDYGAITAVLRYYGDVEKLFTVPAGSFMPMPKVDSAVIRITPYETPRYTPKEEAIFFRTVRGAFELRRKTLPNALSHAFPELPKEALIRAVTDSGFPETIRGERLDCGDFCRVADAISDQLRRS